MKRANDGTQSDQSDEETDKPKKVACRHSSSSNDSFKYKMTHKKRGYAMIFNHENFDDVEDVRTGTDKDCNRFEKVLKKLHFEVKICQDFTFAEIEEKLNKVAHDDELAHHDCLVIVIMSHGEKDGVIHSSDHKYKLEILMEKFTADKCKKLAGKPKLFFVQACRGDKKDPGAEGPKDQRQKADANPSFICRIPIYADFLVAYSTVPGYAAWRNTNDGSWFIQTLCEELEKNGTTHELMNMLTMVNRRVAYEFETYHKDKKTKKLNNVKQIPCITSMLTAALYFENKN